MDTEVLQIPFISIVHMLYHHYADDLIVTIVVCGFTVFLSSPVGNNY